MDAIARAAGLSRATLHRLARDRESVLSGCRGWLLAEINQRLQTPDGTVEAEYEALWKGWGRYLAELRRARVFFELGPWGERTERLWPWPGRLLWLVKKGQDEAVFREGDPELLARLLWGAMHVAGCVVVTSSRAVGVEMMSLARQVCWDALVRRPASD